MDAVCQADSVLQPRARVAAVLCHSFCWSQLMGFNHRICGFEDALAPVFGVVIDELARVAVMRPPAPALGGMRPGPPNPPPMLGRLSPPRPRKNPARRPPRHC
jgi:hypothetical protein